MNIWYNLSTLPNKNYICGYCGKDISSCKGYYIESNISRDASGEGYIYICHHCNKPTYISYGSQTPGAMYGEAFEKEIFEDDLIYQLYEEARKCMKISAFTSVGMCCRKLLMHIAVNCGAKEGQKFIEYVDYLDKNNYIPKNCKEWVDIIRSKGNEANHEIIILNEQDAKQLINFIQILISVIYKMKYEASKYISKSLA